MARLAPATPSSHMTLQRRRAAQNRPTPAALVALHGFWLTFVAHVEALAERVRHEFSAENRARLRRDIAGNVNLGKPMVIVGIFLGAVVLFLIIAQLIKPLFSAAAKVNGALKDPNVTTGDETADSLKIVFPILIGLALLLGVVGLVLGGMAFSKGRKI